MTASPAGMRHTAIATSSDTASAQAAETYADLRKMPIRMRRNARGTTAASADKATECNTGSIGWCHMIMATLLLECRLASTAPCEFRNRSRYPITAFKRLRRSVAVIDGLASELLRIALRDLQAGRRHEAMLAGWRRPREGLRQARWDAPHHRSLRLMFRVTRALCLRWRSALRPGRCCSMRRRRGMRRNLRVMHGARGPSLTD